ncbi:MAG TPA: adenylate/guanylate cyclase domain-containing protein [Planctomycetaceae bacterium]|nr:adenylate/guanylate cyclase domain-containing protein [Planctomycetaceae bacterium]
MSDRRADEILSRLKQSQPPVLEQLDAAREPDVLPLWRDDVRLYRTFGKRLISADHPSRAFELIREGLERFEDDPPLLYLRALALARSGNVNRADEYVDDLLERDIDEPLWTEARSLKGRLYKDRFRRSGNPALRAEFARQSAAQYQQAWKQRRDSFPGINAATMTYLAGRRGPARSLAREVLEQIDAERAQSGREGDYWLPAAAGEALLLCGDVEQSRRAYREAVEMARGNDGDIAAMRLQLMLLEPFVPEARGIIDAVFSLGSVVVFAGHLIDQPGRPAPRFPNEPKLIDAVQREIAGRLERLNARIGYSSVACGADILFCEALLERPGSALHVIVPFDLEDFHRASVDFGRDDMADWRTRCDAVLERAAEVHCATRGPFLEDEILFEYGNSFSQGLAILRAARVGTEPQALCVLDRTSRGTVGTAAFCRMWQAGRRELHVIAIEQLRAACGLNGAPRGGPRQAGARSPKRSRPHAKPGRRVRREFHAMLFADVKNYSKLTDEQAPDFVARFVNRVSSVVNRGRVRPTFQNTWGDGLFFVFDTVPDCAEVALTLLERVEQIDWATVGLPDDTTVRIAVHAGPVYRHLDKIIQRHNYFGSHVNRTARIEPVTTPGCVFASEQFAAALAVLPGHHFTTEYVGVEELAKGYDRCTLYQLGRRV